MTLLVGAWGAALTNSGLATAGETHSADAIPDVPSSAFEQPASVEETPGIDPRAGAALERHGYAVEHTAAQVGDAHLGADLFVALDRGHERALRRIVGDPKRVRLLRSFDPDAGADLDVPDPYYGGAAGFEEVVRMVEAAVPGLLDWVRAHLDA
jgi:protein-tyrosine-phosphatase